MNNIAILYGSSGGNTESVAKRLNEILDSSADLYDVANVKLDDIKAYPYYILGTSTTGIGDLQDDWEGFLPTFKKIDLTDKTIAIFALGDSGSFSSSFAQSMRILYDAVKDQATIIGEVDDEGYTYDESDAVIDGKWVGLAIDEDNEYNLTEERLQGWAKKLKEVFK
ncbi:MAG: flavodoxin [Dysgonamonadaceae bacterium]|jgi:flavodoxin I|nr:flavodoxin [Dysgonamonadaceae bacterium]MDD3309071.1 flavodoxin [Dysgonamonadaceae bacterium]MDD3899875.1 flavodoxin [Dysgonamonadaceae bacterium]MDD4398573.1 flavodoxin [Dysgonamonadaceae bacterium]MEA5080921.1 flavodoxin [Dysgonamonadaceae bacterium]